jgi:predicted nucleic acid-binding protein
MSTLYVIDTNALICYFAHVFNRPSTLSRRAHHIIAQALSTAPVEIKLSIPSVVFIEIFEKWVTNEEFAAKFHYEVFHQITASPNIEIKPIEREVLENLLKIGGSLEDHEIHDKIILASAMMLECSLITIDPAIVEYVNQTKVIPSVIN